MRAYIVKRFLLAVPTFIGATMLVFLLLRVVPGDVALNILGEDATTHPEKLAEIRRALGLKDPLYKQYGLWLWRVFHLDLGKSFMSGFPVVELFKHRLPLTLNLTLYAMLITILLAIPLGVLSAIRQDTWVDYVARVFAVLGLSIPNFWLGLMILTVLVLGFNWFPPLGYQPFWRNPVGNLQQLLWPAVAVGTAQVAIIARMTRSAMLEVLREDYVRTARSKGLRERVVLLRHVLRNASLPIVTLLGVEFTTLMSGVVVTETVFSLPGMGRTVIDGLLTKDYPIIEATTLFIICLVVLVNLLVDLCYAWLDPRISYG
ncbi:Dipeptide transport system permease protein DppB [bacterium HR23]|nr:Dipeptide transport system permease protein DppB [bacterium HR23]